MLRCLRHTGGQNQAAFHIDGRMFLHPEEGFVVFHRPVQIQVSLEPHRSLSLLFHLQPVLPLLSKFSELPVADRTTGRFHDPGIQGHAGFNGKTLGIKLIQQFMMDFLQGIFPGALPKTADDRMIRGG